MTVKKKLTSLLCAAVMLVCLSGCSQSSKANTSSERKTAMPVNSVKLLGRTYAAPDGKIWMGHSGTGVELEYIGEKLTVSLMGNGGAAEHIARIGVFVDGERTSDVCVDEKGSTVEIIGKGDKAVNVKIIKLSECAFSCCAITGADTHGGTITKAADKPRRVEFIGDSITCGYGVDDQDMSHGFSTATEDCTKSYAYKTAQALGADYSLVSFSGYGVVSGYTDTGAKQDTATVPRYYESCGFTENYGFDGVKPSECPWDFSSFTPDAVVVNLGTNDQSYTGSDSARQSEFTQQYVSFLKQIRAKNPKAKIICTLGTMGDLLNGAMKTAAAQYSAETGDNNVAALDLPLQQPETDGVTINGHPSEITHEKTANLLAEKIKSEMNW